MSEATPQEMPAKQPGLRKTKSGAPDKRYADTQSTWQRAQDRWKYVNSVDAENLKNAKQDIEFVWVRGKQWPDQERLAREANQKPWLEINQMPQFVNLTVNEERMQRPGIKIRPGDDEATQDMAKVYEDGVRAIERDSKAPAVYDSAYEQAVTAGRGYWRIVTQYENDMSFNQVIRIKRIPDCLSVRLDPDYQEPDASDIEWGWVLEVMPRNDFKRKYPGKDPLDFGDTSAQAIRDKWVDGPDGVVVADYFEKVYTKDTLVLLSNGKTAFKSDLTQDEYPAGVIDPDTGNYPVTYGKAKIITEREAQKVRVDWHKVYGGGILETYEWKGKYIPIVMVIGVETVIEGARHYQGLIRRARDVQTMYNFWETKATEMLALAPMSQWLTPEGSVDGLEHIWDTANVRYKMRLPYKADPSRPAPQRVDPPAVPAGILEQANQCRNDFYSTIGIYPPNLAQDNKVETSGVALNSRVRQGSQQTFHFADNLARAIEHTGCIIIDLLPKIVDTERDLPQVSYDGKASTVKVNQFNPATGGYDNQLSVGSYKVVVDVGPSYATKRQETAEQMLLFMNAYPAAAPLLGDLLARSQDWDEAEKIAARLQVMLPPQIQMMEAQAGNDPKYAALVTALKNLQQQSQGQMQQMQGALQQLQNQNQALNTQLLQAKAAGAVAKLGAAKQSLGAVVGQKNAEIRAAAESQRTDVEVYNAETQRLGEALDFLLGLIDAHQKQAQINTQQVAAEAASLQPEAQAIQGKP